MVVPFWSLAFCCVHQRAIGQVGCTAFVPAPPTYCWKAKPIISVVKASAKSNKNKDNTTTNTNNNTDIISNDSLSHWLSSPERYAQRLGLTMAQLEAEKTAHQDACETLHQQLSSLSSRDDDNDGNLGRLKHELICQHRYQHGKHAFVCRHCWCYRPICLCHHPLVPVKKIKLPTRVNKVVLWTHHQEWGSISNSGSLLPLLLDHTVMLLKGLPSHNEQLQDLLLHAQQNPQHKVVVLWPDNHHHHHEPRDQTDSTTSISSSSSSSSSSLSRQEWGQVQDMILQPHHQKVESVTLLAVEGTWRTARRMVSKLPPTVVRVALPPSVLFWQQQQLQNSIETNGDHDDSHDITATTTITSQQIPPPPFHSILAPLRHQVGGSHNNVCTAEAVVGALVALGMSQTDGTRILNLVQQKVDLTRRYQGKQQHR